MRHKATHPLKVAPYLVQETPSSPFNTSEGEPILCTDTPGMLVAASARPSDGSQGHEGQIPVQVALCPVQDFGSEMLTPATPWWTLALLRLWAAETGRFEQRPCHRMAACCAQSTRQGFAPDLGLPPS